MQCYFFEPSAIAALSSTSASGFTVSGTWRQQFDWAVIEWNRDNMYEHPAFRNLPDGDLSGLMLTLSGDADELHCDGFGFIRDGGLAVAAGVGDADGRRRRRFTGCR